LQVIHSDLKVRNVLLKSDGSSERGCIAKVSARTRLAAAAAAAAAVCVLLQAPSPVRTSVWCCRAHTHHTHHTPGTHQQVADFGLAVKMDQQDTHVSAFQGTMSHVSEMCECVMCESV
jgi:hypothetical protein